MYISPVPMLSIQVLRILFHCVVIRHGADTFEGHPHEIPGVPGFLVASAEDHFADASGGVLHGFGTRRHPHRHFFCPLTIGIRQHFVHRTGVM